MTALVIPHPRHSSPKKYLEKQRTNCPLSKKLAGSTHNRIGNKTRQPSHKLKRNLFLILNTKLN
jgi:hypothetical protein